MNQKQTKVFCASSSNLADMLTMVKHIDFGGHSSKVKARMGIIDKCWVRRDATLCVVIFSIVLGIKQFYVALIGMIHPNWCYWPNGAPWPLNTSRSYLQGHFKHIQLKVMSNHNFSLVSWIGMMLHTCRPQHKSVSWPRPKLGSPRPVVYDLKVLWQWPKAIGNCAHIAICVLAVTFHW